MSNLQEYCSCDNSCNKECTYHCRRFAIYKSLPRHTANFQYRQLQLIWNTVRVPQSLYMGDLAALNVYQSPGTLGVNWNQMSDRRQPHVQPKLTGDGGHYRSSSTKHTNTGSRPGAQCPGGIGVDVKHGSYDRYLRRLRGKGPARQQPLPTNFGNPIHFNQAAPVYGGKTVKLSIVGPQCECTTR